MLFIEWPLDNSSEHTSRPEIEIWLKVAYYPSAQISKTTICAFWRASPQVCPFRRFTRLPTIIRARLTVLYNGIATSYWAKNQLQKATGNASYVKKDWQLCLQFTSLQCASEGQVERDACFFIPELLHLAHTWQPLPKGGWTRSLLIRSEKREACETPVSKCSLRKVSRQQNVSRSILYVLSKIIQLNTFYIILLVNIG